MSTLHPAERATIAYVHAQTDTVLDWLGLPVPAVAHQFMVIDRDTGEEVAEVVEVNAKEGWLRRFVHDEATGMIRTDEDCAPMIEELHGNFGIRCRRDMAAKA